MENLLRLPSLQSDFTSGASARNLVDVEIPANMGVVDLSRCYVAVKVKADKPNSQIATGIVNAFVDLRKADLTPSIHPLRTTAGFIRHASMHSGMKGKIEELREVKCLRNNLAHYTKTDEDVNGAKGNVAVIAPKQEFTAQTQNELVGIGTDLSRSQTIDIHIPLNEIFDSCNNTGYDTNAHGRTSFHFEFHFDRMFGDSIETQATANTFFAKSTTDGGVNARVRGGGAISHMSNPVTALQLDNTSGGNVVITDPVITTSDYPDLRRCPFYVGQVVSYAINTEDTGGGNPVADISVNATITAIAKSGNTDKLVISTSAQPTLPAGKKIRLVSAGGTGRRLLLDQVAQAVVRTGAGSLDIEAVDLVVQSDPSAPVESPYVYATYPSEQDTYAARNSLFRNYEIPPNCRNVMIFFSPFEAFSTELHLTEYRLTVDGADVLGRKVLNRTALDMELKNAALTNAGIRVKNLEERSKNLTSSRLTLGDAGNYIDAVMFPCDMKSVSQKLGLELVAAAGQNLSGHHIIYYECLKQL